MAMGQMFSPGRINLGGPMRPSVDPVASKPYLPVNNPQRPPSQPSSPVQQQPQQSVLPTEGVRATGTGPYDSAYRQNLATYAGGLFSRPGGLLSFNPTDPNALSGNGPQVGNFAPIGGSPPTLLEQALGGQSYAPQTPAQQQSIPNDYWKFWLKQFNSPMTFLRQSRNSY